MEEYLKRIVIYCPSIDSKVNQEFSFRIIEGKKEFSATCTGIRENCDKCPIIESNNNEIEKVFN